MKNVSAIDHQLFRVTVQLQEVIQLIRSESTGKYGLIREILVESLDSIMQAMLISLNGTVLGAQYDV